MGTCFEKYAQEHLVFNKYVVVFENIIQSHWRTFALESIREYLF